jgi:hypothetical protein
LSFEIFLELIKVFSFIRLVFLVGDLESDIIYLGEGIHNNAPFVQVDGFSFDFNLFEVIS